MGGGDDISPVLVHGKLTKIKKFNLKKSHKRVTGAMDLFTVSPLRQV